MASKLFNAENQTRLVTLIDFANTDINEYTMFDIAICAKYKFIGDLPSTKKPSMLQQFHEKPLEVNTSARHQCSMFSFQLGLIN